MPMGARFKSNHNSVSSHHIECIIFLLTMRRYPRTTVGLRVEGALVTTGIRTTDLRAGDAEHSDIYLRRIRIVGA
jgi:hypothetical protein